MSASSAFAIASRRSAGDNVRSTAARPQRTSRGGSVSSERSAYPIPVVPGSMPRTVSGLGVLQHIVRNVEVGVHLLHVVEILERLDQPQYLMRLVTLDPHGAGRTHRDLGGADRDAGGLDGLLHRFELARRRIHDDERSIDL